jgi:NAD(P)-dependent dehydrogenase (short-subunit alcohol dehydrogenase family)
VDLQLNGKRALVTGSSSGIGAGIARVLAAEGVHVIVHGRHATRTHKVADAIVEAGGHASVVLGDLSTEAGCASVGDEIMEESDGVDILVNNAGGLLASPLSGYITGANYRVDGGQVRSVN